MPSWAPPAARCARQCGLIFGPEFRGAELGTQLDARTAAATASPRVPNDLAVAGYFPVQDVAGAGRACRASKDDLLVRFKVLHLACGLPELHDDRLLADLDHDLRRASLLSRADDAGDFGLGYRGLGGEAWFTPRWVHNAWRVLALSL